jgi:tRNA (mo5U34)-methyltransferase
MSTRATSENSRAGLFAEARQLKWYHTLELPDGYVTPGYFDLRGVSKRVPIPASLAGKRCLDLASSDGFWAC